MTGVLAAGATGVITAALVLPDNASAAKPVKSETAMSNTAAPGADLRISASPRVKSTARASGEPAGEATPRPTAQTNSATSRAPRVKKGKYLRGVGTHFDKTGDEGGGCGVPPAQVESKDFVALNVFDTPRDFTPDLPRAPVPDNINGVWNNGLNCGRWVEITLSDFCTVPNGGAAGQGICRGGQWKRDAFNGATLKAVVTDSCGDPNEWCRSDRNHLDIARGSLGRFTLHGKRVGDLEAMGKWNNRKIEWRFIPAPDYRGDIKIGFAKNASKWYSPVIITNLPNGITSVEYREKGKWKRAKRTGDSGQRYEIQPTSATRTSFSLRITDAGGKRLHNGREYSFEAPSCVASTCRSLYTPVTYTTE
ncbi:hypothetical protein ACFY3O_27755 [Streptomyces sp. NPDC001046]|uniref:hypothetical protein n=1 Tax=Streptomyces sp. NPDC001046 TaxID=3364543 RepID=UPI0036BE0CA6